MLKVTTKSGSIYELDIPNKRVRRLNGKEAPTNRFGGEGGDGGWREYRELSIPPQIGRSMLINWCDNVGNGDSSTVTNLVTEIVEEN
jgi:hypothetical protein